MTTEPLINFFVISAALFAVGVYGLVAKRNALRLIFAVEILINAANLNFLTFSRFLSPANVLGQTAAIFGIALAAAEAAIGLAIVVVAFRLNQDINVFDLRRLRG